MNRREALWAQGNGDVSFQSQAGQQNQTAFDHARVAADRVLIIMLRAVSIHLTTTVGMTIGVRSGSVHQLGIGILEDEVSILIILHRQGQQELRNGEEAPDGRDLVLMVRQSTAGERAGEEEEEGVLPHSKCECREIEGEEMERKSRSEIVLITVLQRHLPGEMDVSTECACLHSAHALNAFGAHVVALSHPHAIAHHDTGEHA